MCPAFDLFRLLLISLAGRLSQQQQEVIDYLQEETTFSANNSEASGCVSTTISADAWPCGPRSWAGAITVQGVVGPLEPDASGNTIRRSGKGVEYVVFTMGHNGSLTPVYSNRPAMVPEIARRRGREAVAHVSVVQENDRQYYVLSAFVEG